MGHKKSIGLKGGPNEYITDIFEFISIEGYKRNSPDVNNPVNIIESSNITMEGVDFPVRGYGNNGIIQDMIPGVENYNYGNADYVVEMPMAQDGGDPEMLFKDEYNTALTKEEKIEYETWVASESKKQDRDIMWDLGTYDIQGFWKSGDHMRMDKDNHGSDKWKKPNHPTFSDQSNYHNINGHVGGTWAEDGAYTPSDYTRTLYDKAYYKKLFGREPNRPEYLKLEEKQRGGGLLNKTMKCNSCGWSWKAADGGSDVSTCHKCGGSALPKAQDGDETSSDLEKEIDGLDLSKYNVRVVQYPYGSKKFSPGHIESVLIDKKTGRQVNKISDTKLVGYINRWAGPGNRRVTQGDYEREEDVRTVDLNLSESEIKNFITEAQLFTGTNKGKEHSKSGLNVRKLPLSINDDNIYDYDFVDSNCATGVCMGLGMDPNSPENTQAGITDPNLVMDGILSKYNDFIVPGSSTGYRTSREDGLRNLVKDNLGENVNAGTIDVLTNYLDGLNRDDINNTLESILQNPTALKILKDDGDLSKIGDRAIRDLTSIFNSYNPFVDVGRGREQMARKNIDNIKRDVVNIYESIPEGTIPAALEALNEQYIKPNNPFDVSLEGVKNIPGWWKNKLGFKEGGSTTNPYTIYMNYINGIDESEVAQNIFDKLNRMHYRDAKTRGMGVANYIASNIIPNS